MGATAATVLFAGCDYPRHRSLSFSSVQIQRSSGEYVAEVVPKMSWSAEDESWATFHNVTLIGYDEHGNQLCTLHLGDVLLSGTGEPIHLRCTGFPEEFRYRADEDPCGEDTEIDKAVYIGRIDGDHTYRIEDPIC